ncbi:unnamed protein product, partial [Pylaiella littoralis]
MEVDIGARLHTGRWMTNGEWGTVMKRNMDNGCVIVSYDVFMDNSTRVSTVVAASVEGDVAHAR